MSFLSTTENVGFSGIPQNISDASCATQYKLAVEGVSGNCGDVNMFIQDSSGDEQTYIPHLNENFFQTKFKIDPNELYTFHDSDIIAGEITVSHTDDNFMFPDNVEVKAKFLDSPNNEVDLQIKGSLPNGEVIRDEIKLEIVPNGHCMPEPQHLVTPVTPNYKDVKSSNTKVPKAKNPSHGKEISRSNSVEARRPSVHSPKGQSNNVASCKKVSINSLNTNHSKSSLNPKLLGSETFLDVFKREQGLVENAPTVIKTESPTAPPPKNTSSSVKKTPAAKSSQSKVRRGRGPAVHEALQRIPTPRAVPVPNRAWHAPGDSLFDCGPLDDRPPGLRQFESSSDDDNVPEFELGTGPVCVEESAAESRGARLALRRAALRRQVVRADTSLRLARDYREYKSLAAIIKKQLNVQGSRCRLPTQMVNHLLAMRGMPEVLSSRERRRLREAGWSGGESGAARPWPGAACSEQGCAAPRLPCARFCLAHVTLAPEQRLYAACAAVFAGGARCKQPILPLRDHTPLCAEHAWKRDNYDKMSRDCKPKKLAKKRVQAAAPRRAKRRRRPPRARPAPAPGHCLSEINVCSNSSAYDSSEDAGMGALSESEFIVSATNSHELEVGEVGQVPPDDILDPAVLSQIPDEAFTEFFNQGGSSFAESSELAAALEAVLDERALDSIGDVFQHSPHQPKPKMQVPASVAMEMSTSAPS